MNTTRKEDNTGSTVHGNHGAILGRGNELAATGDSTDPNEKTNTMNAPVCNADLISDKYTLSVTSPSHHQTSPCCFIHSVITGVHPFSPTQPELQETKKYQPLRRSLVSRRIHQLLTFSFWLPPFQQATRLSNQYHKDRRRMNSRLSRLGGLSTIGKSIGYLMISWLNIIMALSVVLCLSNMAMDQMTTQPFSAIPSLSDFKTQRFNGTKWSNENHTSAFSFDLFGNIGVEGMSLRGERKAIRGRVKRSTLVSSCEDDNQCKLLSVPSSYLQLMYASSSLYYPNQDADLYASYDPTCTKQQHPSTLFNNEIPFFDSLSEYSILYRNFTQEHSSLLSTVFLTSNSNQSTDFETLTSSCSPSNPQVNYLMQNPMIISNATNTYPLVFKYGTTSYAGSDGLFLFGGVHENGKQIIILPILNQHRAGLFSHYDQWLGIKHEDFCSYNNVEYEDYVNNFLKREDGSNFSIDTEMWIKSVRSMGMAVPFISYNSSSNVFTLSDTVQVASSSIHDFKFTIFFQDGRYHFFGAILFDGGNLVTWLDDYTKSIKIFPYQFIQIDVSHKRIYALASNSTLFRIEATQPLTSLDGLQSKYDIYLEQKGSEGLNIVAFVVDRDISLITNYDMEDSVMLWVLDNGHYVYVKGNNEYCQVNDAYCIQGQNTSRVITQYTKQTSLILPVSKGITRIYFQSGSCVLVLNSNDIYIWGFNNNGRLILNSTEAVVPYPYLVDFKIPYLYNSESISKIVVHDTYSLVITSLNRVLLVTLLELANLNVKFFKPDLSLSSLIALDNKVMVQDATSIFSSLKINSIMRIPQQVTFGSSALVVETNNSTFLLTLAPNKMISKFDLYSASLGSGFYSTACGSVPINMALEYSNVSMIAQFKGSAFVNGTFYGPSYAVMDDKWKAWGVNLKSLFGSNFSIDNLLDLTYRSVNVESIAIGDTFSILSSNSSKLSFSQGQAFLNTTISDHAFRLQLPDGGFASSFDLYSGESFDRSTSAGYKIDLSCSCVISSFGNLYCWGGLISSLITSSFNPYIDGKQLYAIIDISQSLVQFNIDIVSPKMVSVGAGHLSVLDQNNDIYRLGLNVFDMYGLNIPNTKYESSDTLPKETFTISTFTNNATKNLVSEIYILKVSNSVDCRKVVALSSGTFCIGSDNHLYYQLVMPNIAALSNFLSVSTLDVGNSYITGVNSSCPYSMTSSTLDEISLNFNSTSFSKFEKLKDYSIRDISGNDYTLSITTDNDRLFKLTYIGPFDAFKIGNNYCNGNLLDSIYSSLSPVFTGNRRIIDAKVSRGDVLFIVDPSKCADGFFGNNCNLIGSCPTAQIENTYCINAKTVKLPTGYGMSFSKNQTSYCWYGKCLCRIGFIGNNCDIPQCFNKTSFDSSETACGGTDRGVCIAPDTCKCKEALFSGNECKTTVQPTVIIDVGTSIISTAQNMIFFDSDIGSTLAKQICKETGDLIINASRTFSDAVAIYGNEWGISTDNTNVFLFSWNVTVSSNASASNSRLQQHVDTLKNSSVLTLPSTLFSNYQTYSFVLTVLNQKNNASTTVVLVVNTLNCSSYGRVCFRDEDCNYVAEKQSGGLCENNIGICSCLPGYIGPLCDTPLSYFTPNVSLHVDDNLRHVSESGIFYTDNNDEFVLNANQTAIPISKFGSRTECFWRAIVGNSSLYNMLSYNKISHQVHDGFVWSVSTSDMLPTITYQFEFVMKTTLPDQSIIESSNSVLIQRNGGPNVVARINAGIKEESLPLYSIRNKGDLDGMYTDGYIHLSSTSYDPQHLPLFGNRKESFQWKCYCAEGNTFELKNISVLESYKASNIVKACNFAMNDTNSIVSVPIQYLEYYKTYIFSLTYGIGDRVDSTWFTLRTLQSTVSWSIRVSPNIASQFIDPTSPLVLNAEIIPGGIHLAGVENLKWVWTVNYLGKEKAPLSNPIMVATATDSILNLKPSDMQLYESDTSRGASVYDFSVRAQINSQNWISYNFSKLISTKKAGDILGSTKILISPLVAGMNRPLMDDFTISLPEWVATEEIMHYEVYYTISGQEAGMDNPLRLLTSKTRNSVIITKLPFSHTGFLMLHVFAITTKESSESENYHYWLGSADIELSVNRTAPLTTGNAYIDQANTIAANIQENITDLMPQIPKILAANNMSLFDPNLIIDLFLSLDKLVVSMNELTKFGYMDFNNSFESNLVTRVIDIAVLTEEKYQDLFNQSYFTLDTRSIIDNNLLQLVHSLLRQPQSFSNVTAAYLTDTLVKTVLKRSLQHSNSFISTKFITVDKSGGYSKYSLKDVTSLQNAKSELLVSVLSSLMSSMNASTNLLTNYQTVTEFCQQWVQILSLRLLQEAAPSTSVSIVTSNVEIAYKREILGTLLGTSDEKGIAINYSNSTREWKVNGNLLLVELPHEIRQQSLFVSNEDSESTLETDSHERLFYNSLDSFLSSPLPLNISDQYVAFKIVSFKNPDGDSRQTILGNVMISVELLFNQQPLKLKDLRSPIEMVFLADTSVYLPNYLWLGGGCHYWNETLSEWSKDGCKTVASYAFFGHGNTPSGNTISSDLNPSMNRIYCVCNHTTLFSVLKTNETNVSAVESLTNKIWGDFAVNIVLVLFCVFLLISLFLIRTEHNIALKFRGAIPFFGITVVLLEALIDIARDGMIMNIFLTGVEIPYNDTIDGAFRTFIDPLYGAMLFIYMSSILQFYHKERYQYLMKRYNEKDVKYSIRRYAKFTSRTYLVMPTLALYSAQTVTYIILLVLASVKVMDFDLVFTIFSLIRAGIIAFSVLFSFGVILFMEFFMKRILNLNDVKNDSFLKYEGTFNGDVFLFRLEWIALTFMGSLLVLAEGYDVVNTMYPSLYSNTFEEGSVFYQLYTRQAHIHMLEIAAIILLFMVRCLILLVYGGFIACMTARKHTICCCISGKETSTTSDSELFDVVNDPVLGPLFEFYAMKEFQLPLLYLYKQLTDISSFDGPHSVFERSQHVRKIYKRFLKKYSPFPVSINRRTMRMFHHRKEQDEAITTQEMEDLISILQVETTEYMMGMYWRFKQTETYKKNEKRSVVNPYLNEDL